MPEDVTDKLAKFTPTGLDRDAVLFAAGKAAARGSQVWKWLAAALAVSNAVTLALFLWPRTPAITPNPALPPSRPDSPPIVVPSSGSAADDLPPLAAADGLVPDGPLLTAGSLDSFHTLFRDAP